MEVPSTTNPLPPSGGTNTVAPLGISSSLSISKTEELESVQYPDWFSANVPVLIGDFTLSTSQTVGTKVFSWTTEVSELDYYRPDPADTKNTILPWSLVRPYFSKMTRMEYALIFKPIKVTDAEVRLHAIYNYTGDFVGSYTSDALANHNEMFSFDDSSDIKILSVPQFFMHNNQQTNKNVINLNTEWYQSYVPSTTLDIFVANVYQPNLAQPDSFKVKVFLVPIPTNIKTIAARRGVKGGLEGGNNFDIYPHPYFM
uniref:Structural protein 2 n=1 Tax=Chipolycivirus sp. TaxID=2809300 RepID=A0AAU8JNG4_9VIRU